MAQDDKKKLESDATRRVPVRTKKPYSAPSVRVLGSVRDLTRAPHPSTGK